MFSARLPGRPKTSPHPPKKQIALAQKKRRSKMKDAGFKRVTFWLEESNVEKVKAICEGRGITQAELINKMIDLGSTNKCNRYTTLTARN